MTGAQDRAASDRAGAGRRLHGADRPEADGTLAWTGTAPVLAGLGGETGLGLSRTGAPAAGLIAGPLAGAVEGLSALDPAREPHRAAAAVRGRAGGEGAGAGGHVVRPRPMR